MPQNAGHYWSDTFLPASQYVTPSTPLFGHCSRGGEVSFSFSRSGFPHSSLPRAPPWNCGAPLSLQTDEGGRPWVGAPSAPGYGSHPFAAWGGIKEVPAHRSPGWPLTLQLKIILDFGSSWLYLLSARNRGLYHHLWFMCCWGLNPGPFHC